MTVDAMPREVVKDLYKVMEIFEVCAMKDSKFNAPEDLVVSHYLCKTAVNDFLDNTTEKEWAGVKEHMAYVGFIAQSKNKVLELALHKLLTSLVKNSDD